MYFIKFVIMQDYNLDKNIEIKGMWYLPAHPEKRVAGILYYTPNKTLKLELIGSFWGRKESIFETDVTDVIYGEGSDAQKISLFYCYPSKSFNFSCSFELTNYSCDFCLIGIHTSNLDNKGKYELFAKIEELTYWCQPKALTQYFLKANNAKDEKICVGFNTKSNGDNIISSVNIDDNTTISLKGCVRHEGDTFFPKIEQYTGLKISSVQDISFKLLLSKLYLYESFLSFALMRKVKAFKIVFYSDDLYQLFADDRKVYKPITFIHPYKERINSKERKISIHDFMFDYDHIKQIYPDVIKKWYTESVDLSPIRDHLIKSVESKVLYDSTDFLIVIQAIEGFWWRFRNDEYLKNHKKDASLKELITELLAEFNDVKKITSLNIDIKAIVDSRHFYSHFLKKDEKPKKLDGEELYSATQKLRILLICCIMSFIGFSHEDIDSIMNNNEL